MPRESFVLSSRFQSSNPELRAMNPKNRKGLLDGASCYLCGPIKGPVDDGVIWRKEITPRLENFGVQVVDPCQKGDDLGETLDDKAYFTSIIQSEDWERLKIEFWPVVRWDLKKVDRADFIVFNYDAKVQTIGSIHELVVAQFEKKPILLKYDRAQLDVFNPWIAVLIKKNHFFHDWDQMFEYLEKVDSGNIDTSYWV